MTRVNSSEFERNLTGRYFITDRSRVSLSVSTLYRKSTLTYIMYNQPNAYRIQRYLWILTLLLLSTTCPVLANSVDPDQLASGDSNWSGSALFVIKYVNFYQKPGSSNLIGCKLEVGMASYSVWQGLIVQNLTLTGTYFITDRSRVSLSGT